MDISRSSFSGIPPLIEYSRYFYKQIICLDENEMSRNIEIDAELAKALDKLILYLR